MTGKEPTLPASAEQTNDKWMQSLPSLPPTAQPTTQLPKDYLPAAALTVVCWPFNQTEVVEQSSKDSNRALWLPFIAAAILTVFNHHAWWLLFLLAVVVVETLNRRKKGLPDSFPPVTVCWMWVIWSGAFQTLFQGTLCIQILQYGVPILMGILYRLTTLNAVYALCFTYSQVILCRPGYFATANSSFPLSEIDRIALSKDGQKIEFCATARVKFEIKLTSIPNLHEWQNITDFILHKSNTQNIAIDPSIAQSLHSSTTDDAPVTFTQLWLESFAAPPVRERLAPLVQGIALKEKRYVVETPIGAGGQGSVYLCEDTRQKCKVVLKEYMLPVHNGRAIRERAIEGFHNEATLLSKLQHPGVVQIRDYFVEDHRGYLVLEFLQGKSLRHRVREEGPMSELEVIKLALQMAQILAYLASQAPPIVHRDFTPDNLILGTDGKLRLIDFTIAMAKGPEEREQPAGKQAYMPPEQFRGKPCTESDVYAMGATLHFLLTGEDPEAITSSHPTLKTPSISERMDGIVASLTALNVNDRLVGLKDLKQLEQALSTSCSNLVVETQGESV